MPRGREVQIEFLCGSSLGHERVVRASAPRKRKTAAEGRGNDFPKPRKPKSAKELKGTAVWVPVLDVCGQRYVVKVDRDYGSEKAEGACTWADNLIEILEQAPDRMHDALLHEIIHAITDASGMKWMIAEKFPKLSRKERRALDELLCRVFAPALLATLRNVGWLKLPSFPPKKVRGKRT